MQPTGPGSSLLRRGVVGSPLGRISVAGYGHADRRVRRSRMRVLGSYAVAYVLAGGGRYADGQGVEASLTPGDLIVVFPEIPHIYGPEHGGLWSEIFIVFDGPVFDLWRDLGILDPERPIRRLEPVQRWASRLESVVEYRSIARRVTASQTICELQVVLADALSPTNEADSDRDWAEQVRELVHPEVSLATDFRAVARSMHMSYDGFRKRFRRAFGTSPARYRSIVVIDRACELMLDGRMSDREIAHALGFCDQYYFSRRFKQITGRSPKAFRAGLPSSLSPAP